MRETHTHTTVSRKVYIQRLTLEKTASAIKIGQYRDTGNIGHKRERAKTNRKYTQHRTKILRFTDPNKTY